MSWRTLGFLVSETGIHFGTLSPLAVKGKREPLTVPAAEKAGG
jgi:hypothetical protein